MKLPRFLRRCTCQAYSYWWSARTAPIRAKRPVHMPDCPRRRWRKPPRYVPQGIRPHE